MKNHESKLQQSCIAWFDYQYPKYRMLLFAIPNGGKRNIVTASIQKREGVRSGVADLFLAVPSSDNNGTFIEMKFGNGKQSENQKEFESAVKSNYRYEVVNSLDRFMEVVNSIICFIAFFLVVLNLNNAQ